MVISVNMLNGSAGLMKNYFQMTHTPIGSNSTEEVFGIWYQVLTSGNFFRFLYFTIRYIKYTLISDKHQYRIPNTQYHLIEYRSIKCHIPVNWNKNGIKFRGHLVSCF